MKPFCFMCAPIPSTDIYSKNRMPDSCCNHELRFKQSRSTVHISPPTVNQQMTNGHSFFSLVRNLTLGQIYNHWNIHFQWIFISFICKWLKQTMWNIDMDEVQEFAFTFLKALKFIKIPMKITIPCPWCLYKIVTFTQQTPFYM